MKLLPAVAGLVLVGCALPVLADDPMPDMLAQATLQGVGVTVTWTAPAASVDGYTVARSHAGAAFAPIASVASGVYSFIDATGGPSDLYMVYGTVERVVTSKSNPAPAMVDMSCPWFTDDMPPGVNCTCFPCP